MPQKLNYLESHVGSIERGIELINQMGWNISTKEMSHSIFVLAGDQPILETDSQEQVTAFTYGMALAYSILSDDIIHDIRKEAGIE